MKLLLFFLSLLTFNSAFAQMAQVYSIDNYDWGKNYVEVSEEALPSDHYAQLVSMTSAFGFTTLTDGQIKSLFDVLKSDSKARWKVAGGGCAVRRAYIQNFLKKINIASGRLYINCPARNGRMRLRDRASGHNYTFANFHDVNILSVTTPKGRAFRVLDVQFEDGPVSLHDYLAEVEASQKIKPLKRRGTTKGMCYWNVSSSKTSFKRFDQ